MNKSLKRHWFLTFLYLSFAFTLHMLSRLLSEESMDLERKNTYYENLIKILKTSSSSEQFIPLLSNLPQGDLGEKLIQCAKNHYIDLDNLRSFFDQGGRKILQVHFTAELDTDLFHYLQTLYTTHKNRLAFKEIELSRGKKGIKGKIIFNVFTPYAMEKDQKND